MCIASFEYFMSPKDLIVTIYGRWWLLWKICVPVGTSTSFLGEVLLRCDCSANECGFIPSSCLLTFGSGLTKYLGLLQSADTLRAVRQSLLHILNRVWTDFGPIHNNY
jgi:hypothetical protein